jgi:hypothetical protein
LGTKERTGIEGRQRLAPEPGGDGACLSLSGGVQREIGATPKALHAGTFVPGSLTVTDQDESDHVVSFGRVGDIVIVSR